MNRTHWFHYWFRANIQSMSFWTILSIHGLLLGWISVVNAPMFDEIAHLPSGLYHWHFGTFDLYRVNPPLMRMIASMPLLVVNPRVDWTLISDGPYERAEFALGHRFMEINGYDSFWYFTICRWTQIPVSMLGGWVCFRWARELFGTSSGFVALLFWCFCPNILAWGSTITPDIGAAAFGLAAAYVFWLWLRAPSWRIAFVSGAVTGLAELSKSTWIILFVLWPIIWFCWWYRVRKLPTLKPQATQLACILLFAIYILNLGYGFENSFQRLGQFNFISRALGGTGAHDTPGNRFRDTWLGAIPAPVPANYLRGIDAQKFDFEKGKWSYLRGEQKIGGWWYYYLYAIAVKTPLGTLLVLGLSAVLIVSNRTYTSRGLDEMVLLLPAIAVLVLISSQTGFNRYLRYALPAIPFIYIFASRIGKAFETNQLIPQVLCGIGIATSILGSLSIYPHSMSFFNLAAGGPLGGPRHLLDANIDWGQDLLELKRFIDRHPDIGTITLSYFGLADPKFAGIPFKPLLLSSDGEGVAGLVPGWYAVSVNHLFGYRHFERDDQRFIGFQRFIPVAKAGYSIYIYHITSRDLTDVAKAH